MFSEGHNKLTTLNSTMVRFIWLETLVPVGIGLTLNSTMVRFIFGENIVAEPLEVFKFHYGKIHISEQDAEYNQLLALNSTMVRFIL